MSGQASFGGEPGGVGHEAELPSRLRADAWVLGSRLDHHGLAEAKLVAHGPSTYALGRGAHLAAFRYGVVVFFGLPEDEQAAWLEGLAPFVTAPLDEPEHDRLELRADSEAREGLDTDGVLVLSALGVERLQIVAHVLAKSTVLALYERRVAKGFQRVEARGLGPARGSGRRLDRELLREIQEAFAIRVDTIGRVETTEKPEILWDAPGLDPLYELLAVEFELRERDIALSRKLQLISDGASSSLELIHTHRALRVEWYIVALIAIEIVLFVYDIAR
jgi:uncharacterized Rmd1/YagE family protein